MAIVPNSDSTSIQGLFKNIYADQIQILTPDAAALTKVIGFNQKTMTGRTYNQPVVLSRYHGATYFQNSAGAAALDAPISMIEQNAEVEGCNMVNRATVSYELEERTKLGGAQSFKDASKHVVMELLESSVYRLECGLFYGQTGIAAVNNTSVVAQAGAEITLQILPQAWSSWIWSGAENARVIFVNTATGLQVAAGVFDVTSAVTTPVDVDNKQITLTEETGGDAAALAVIIGALVGTATIDVYFTTALNNECAGLKKIMTNTGTLFGVDAAQYSLWKGNVYDVGGTDLDQAKLEQGLNRAIGRGLKNMDVDLFVSPPAWGFLNDSLAAKRMYDSSYKEEGTNGFKSIKYYSSNGSITVHSCGYVKLGDAFLFPKEHVKRIGSSDVKFQYKVEGGNEIYFTTLANNAGFEFRTFYNQAAFIEKPAQCVYFRNITTTGA